MYFWKNIREIGRGAAIFYVGDSQNNKGER